jgi:hypothetical protein
MSVINVTRMWSKTGGQGSSAKYDNFATQFSLTECYQVLAEIGDTTPTIADSGLLPAYGDQHFSGVDAYVRKKQAEQISPILWQVTIGYEGQPFDPNVDIEWTDSTSTEPIDRDFDGRAILTANYEPVDGLSMEISDSVVVIRRKFFTVDTFIAPPNIDTQPTLTPTSDGLPAQQDSSGTPQKINSSSVPRSNSGTSLPGSSFAAHWREQRPRRRGTSDGDTKGCTSNLAQ